MFTLRNVTVSGNVARRNFGGGVVNESGTLYIASSTITDNQAIQYRGLYTPANAERGPSRTFVQNSVIAGNQNPEGPAEFDIGGDGDFVIASLGHNFIGKAIDGNPFFVDGENNDIVGTGIEPIDPLLGPLRDNGGPTLTHAPLPSSPLIDTGNADLVPVDQRGRSRRLDASQTGVGRSDIGAVEFSNVLLEGLLFNDLNLNGLRAIWEKRGWAKRSCTWTAMETSCSTRGNRPALPKKTIR